jgi:MoaA/NifB/PqqE/SkfB family radical SAM enzyme
MSEKIERILNWFYGKPSYPFKIIMIPTNRCNLNCPYCPNALPRWKGEFKETDELSTKEWEKIVKEGLKLGVKEWSIIGGGEPFLRKDVVMNTIKLVKNFHDTECEVITNGTLIDENTSKKIVEFGLDRILISIDGPNEKIHDSLRRVKGAFKRATYFIKNVNKWKKMMKKEKPYIKINMVINKKNFDKINEMLLFLKGLEVQELALHPMREYFTSISLNSLQLNPREKKYLTKMIEKAKELAEKTKIKLNIDMITLELNDQKKIDTFINSKLRKRIEKCFCFEPLYNIFIDASGLANGCSPSGKGKEELDVKKKSLREIWFSNEFEKIRKIVMSGKHFDYCSKCGLTDMKIHIKNELLKEIRNEI